MKIFLPYKFKDIGGPTTFARKFAQGMTVAGHQVIFDYEPDYDVLFLIVQCPFKYLFDAKVRGKKIVQRLDGVFYWSVAGWKFPLLNAKAALIRHLFTDFTVYQSQYSRDCCDRFLGVKRNDQHAIIYNGVDLNLFSPEGKTKKLKDNSEQKIFFTASVFRRKDQILPIIEALGVYQKKFSDNFKLLVAGNFIGKAADIPACFKNHRRIQFIGKIANEELAQYERAADVFLFTHLNPPCPNNVIEAMASGVPICGVADGAMPEIVSPGKNGELVGAQGSGFWRKRPFDATGFAVNLHKIVNSQNQYANRSVTTAHKRFSLKTMCRTYSQGLELLVK